MIAASLKDGEALVSLLLQKGADANLKSEISTIIPTPFSFPTIELSNSCMTQTTMDRLVKQSTPGFLPSKEAQTS